MAIHNFHAHLTHISSGENEDLSSDQFTLGAHARRIRKHVTHDASGVKRAWGKAGGLQRTIIASQSA